MPTRLKSISFLLKKRLQIVSKVSTMNLSMLKIFEELSLGTKKE